MKRDEKKVKGGEEKKVKFFYSLLLLHKEEVCRVYTDIHLFIYWSVNPPSTHTLATLLLVLSSENSLVNLPQSSLVVLYVGFRRLQHKLSLLLAKGTLEGGELLHVHVHCFELIRICVSVEERHVNNHGLLLFSLEHVAVLWTVFLLQDFVVYLWERLLHCSCIISGKSQSLCREQFQIIYFIIFLHISQPCDICWS